MIIWEKIKPHAIAHQREEGTLQFLLKLAFNSRPLVATLLLLQGPNANYGNDAQKDASKIFRKYFLPNFILQQINPDTKFNAFVRYQTKQTTMFNMMHLYHLL